MHLATAWHKIERTSIVLGAPASKTNFLNKTPKEDHDEKVSVFGDYNAVVDEHDDEDLVDFGQRR